MLGIGGEGDVASFSSLQEGSPKPPDMIPETALVDVMQVLKLSSEVTSTEIDGLVQSKDESPSVKSDVLAKLFAPTPPAESVSEKEQRKEKQLCPTRTVYVARNFNHPPPPFPEMPLPPFMGQNVYPPPPNFAIPPPNFVRPPPQVFTRSPRGHFGSSRNSRPRENPEIPKDKLTDFMPSSVRLFSSQRAQVAHPRTTSRKGRGRGAHAGAVHAASFPVVAAVEVSEPVFPQVENTETKSTTPNVPAGRPRKERKSRVAALKPAQPQAD